MTVLRVIHGILLLTLASTGCAGGPEAAKPSSATSGAATAGMTPATEAALNRIRRATSMGSCPASIVQLAFPPIPTGPADAGLRDTRLIRAEVNGCGKTYYLNYVVGTTAEGRHLQIPQVHGTTLTDPRLQADAKPMVLAVVLASVRTACRQAEVRAGLVEGPLPAAGTTRAITPWTEVWSVEACGTIYSVRVVFTPNAAGTRFDVLSGTVQRAS